MDDKSQRDAIFYPPDQSMLVVAPPGYGKTYVMTKRVSYLLQSGHVRPPNRILGLTFTNAAAGEMMDRVKKEVTHRLHDFVSIMTFHSFCYKILRAYGNYLGIDREFRVLGSVQSSTLLRELFREAGVEIDRDYPQNTEEIRNYENWLTERILRINTDFQDQQFEGLFETIYAQYVQCLGDGSLLDFVHILLRGYELFLEHPQILELYRSVFSYILVDEFHDTNPLQFELLRLLAQGHPGTEDRGAPKPVYILADQNQAIYEFQGARPENVQIARRMFACSEMSLEQNHRTESESIVWLARSFWDESITFPEDSELEKVRLSISDDPVEESERIIERIQRYEGPLHEICVVAQSSYRLYPIRDALREDTTNLPFVFVPDFSSQSIETNYEDIFEPISELAQVSARRGRLTTHVRSICDEFRERWQEDEVVKLLLRLAQRYDYKYSDLTLPERALEFSNDLMLDINWGDLLRRNVRDRIFLSTIHGVKGLQFEQVHVCGLSNFEHIHYTTCYPCQWGRNRADLTEDLEEPFRTLYVAVTRAQNELFLYAARQNHAGRQRSPICLLGPLLPFLRVEGVRETEEIARAICGSR
jgi:DNA helicase-2/ATP-dependent DNA helicase PcrA